MKRREFIAGAALSMALLSSKDSEKVSFLALNCWHPSSRFAQDQLRAIGGVDIGDLAADGAPSD